MKALFLGNVAADTANGIRDRLPPGLNVEIFGDPQQLMQSPEAAADADILVTNHWRAEYPPAPRAERRASGSVQAGAVRATCSIAFLFLSAPARQSPT